MKKVISFILLLLFVCAVLKQPSLKRLAFHQSVNDWLFILDKGFGDLG